MLNPPMSSPQMMRMFGFLLAACAVEATAANTAMPTHRNSIAMDFFMRILSAGFGFNTLSILHIRSYGMGAAWRQMPAQQPVLHQLCLPGLLAFEAAERFSGFSARFHPVRRQIRNAHRAAS